MRSLSSETIATASRARAANSSGVYGTSSALRSTAKWVSSSAIPSCGISRVTTASGLPPRAPLGFILSPCESRPPMPNAFDTSIFKSYDVRGIVGSQLTPETAYLLGRAFVQALGRTNICIGRDMRPSGEALMDALTRGAVDAGADVTHIGMISTDALYFAVGHYGFDGGVMITASHNPAEYNGLKFCREEAQAISLDTGLGDVRDLALSGEFTEPSRKGSVAEQEVLDDFGRHCV